MLKVGLVTVTILWFIFMSYLSHQNGEHTKHTGYVLAECFSFLPIDILMINSFLR